MHVEPQQEAVHAIWLVSEPVLVQAERGDNFNTKACAAGQRKLLAAVNSSLQAQEQLSRALGITCSHQRRSRASTCTGSRAQRLWETALAEGCVP